MHRRDGGERRAGLTLGVVGRQLAASLPETASASDTVVAYEPVWAIGTGLTPSTADVAEVHRFCAAHSPIATAKRAGACACSTAGL